MHKEFERPADQISLEDREAKGLWKAIALSKEIAEGSRPLDLSVLLDIHRVILAEAQPDAAGKFRVTGQDVKKLECIEPPPGAAVNEKMYLFEKDLAHRLDLIPPVPENKKSKQYRLWLDAVFDLAAWVQHSLVAIHPFCEANGRLARLMTNVVLGRFRLPSSSVKIEGENKPKYLEALCRIDTESDYRALKTLIIRGSIATYRKEVQRRKQIKKQ